MDSPEQIRARFSEIPQNGFSGRSRRGYPQYRDVIQPTPGRRSRMDDHVLNMTSVKAEADMRYQLSLYQRAQEGVPWKMRCLPYVYLIGVTKSGTSDFYRYLTSHQDVVESRAKEIHYWNVRRFPRYTKLYGLYLSTSLFLYLYLFYLAQCLSLSSSLSLSLSSSLSIFLYLPISVYACVCV